jgi:hypothetical protein
MAASDQHVVPLPGDVWGVTTEGSGEYTDVYDSKADAIDAAISIARREGVDLIVHGKSGQPFLSPPGSSLDDYSLRHGVRVGGQVETKGRKAAKGGGSPRKSPGASAKKGGGAGGRGGAKKAGGSKASARKSAAGKGGAKKSAAKAAKSAAARKSSGKAGGRR